MLASKVVNVLTPSCWALAISVRLRMEKSSSPPIAMWWRSRSRLPICFSARETSSALAALTMSMPGMNFCNPP